MPHFHDNDMVCSRSNEKLLFGGYEVESTFLNNNIPTSYRLNDNSMFGGLAVPSGLLYLSSYSGLTNELEDKEISGGSAMVDSIINDDLYDKLFQLSQNGGTNQLNIEKNTEQKHTKRNKQYTKQTRKNKLYF